MPRDGTNQVNKLSYVLDGYCGVYCGACPVMLATKTGELDESQQCYGYKSEKPTGFCSTCGIKACASSKRFEFCIECSEITNCDLMQKFIADQQYPYGRCVLKNMEKIQIIGLSSWLKMQEKRWRCEYCGEPYSWYRVTCAKCGNVVKSYQADL